MKQLHLERVKCLKNLIFTRCKLREMRWLMTRVVASSLISESFTVLIFTLIFCLNNSTKSLRKRENLIHHCKLHFALKFFNFLKAQNSTRALTLFTRCWRARNCSGIIFHTFSSVENLENVNSHLHDRKVQSKWHFLLPFDAFAISRLACPMSITNVCLMALVIKYFPTVAVRQLQQFLHSSLIIMIFFCVCAKVTNYWNYRSPAAAVPLVVTMYHFFRILSTYLFHSLDALCLQNKCEMHIHSILSSF